MKNKKIETPKMRAEKWAMIRNCRHAIKILKMSKVGMEEFHDYDRWADRHAMWFKKQITKLQKSLQKGG